MTFFLNTEVNVTSPSAFSASTETFFSSSNKVVRFRKAKIP